MTGWQVGRLFAYPMTIRHDDGYLIGTLPDWPECQPVGRTLDDVTADAIGSISKFAVTRMEDGEPVPLVGSRFVGWANEVLVRLPWSLWARFAAYAAVHWACRLVV